MLTAVLALVGCGDVHVEEVGLLAAGPPPEVLTERAGVAPPNREVGTRFVRGWTFTRTGDGMTIRPTDETAVLEVVELGGRPRTLVLDLAPGAGHSSSRVTATAMGRPLGTYPMCARTKIPLPADVGPGRVPIQLAFSSPDEVALRRASVGPTAPRGKVDVATDEIRQSGFSAVELLRLAPPGSTIAGTFVPPSGPRPAQRLELRVEGDRSRTVLAWSAREGRAAPISFAARLVEGPEPRAVRITMLAQGVGPPATWRDLVLRRPRRAPPPDVAPPRPPRLVVLYVLDALRADALGAFGGRPDVTPVLDQLASEGAAFARHFSAAPNTAPSTKALFTGHTFLSGGALPADGPETLAEAFARAGYRTAAVTSNPYFARELGLGRGFEGIRMLPITEDFHPGASPTVNDSAAQVDRAALEWLDGLGEDDRAFLYIHSLNPHNPYTPPPPFAGRFSSAAASWLDGSTATLVQIRDGRRALTDADVARLRGLYLDGVAYNDDRIGIFLERLRARFAERDVLFVVTADHGEELADHGGVFHGHTLYDEVLHIPLIVRWKGVVPTGRIEHLTDTVDLHDTLAALTGPHRGTATQSLWPELLGPLKTPPPGERIVFAAAPGLRHGYMARSSRWKLILAHRRGLDFGMGQGPGRTHDAEYVFDLEHDPAERHNLAGTTAPEVAWLRGSLGTWVRTHRNTGGAAPVHLDATTRRRLEALGYRE